MTPDERAAISRANARASTGPRTAAGKARVAGNARRHGLSVPTRDGDPAGALALAAAIAGRRTAAQVCAAALDLAHAQLELRRVRRHRERLLEAVEGPAALRDGLVGELSVLDRYETRARARRKAALRAFDRACREGSGETAKQSRQG